MDKPNNYDITQVFADGRTLPPGGYICKIIGIKESKSKSGKDMIEIGLDIAEGECKDFYKEKYDADTRENKKWGCVVYQLVYDENNNCNRGFKTFITSVEESNSGFKVVWGNQFCKCLKDKLVGGLFRREQFKAQDGKVLFATKCFSFRSTETIKKGVEVPEDKLLKEDKQKSTFYTVETNIDDDDLPF